MYYLKLAKKLRNSATDSEKLLWKHLRSRQMKGFKFRRQHPIGNYIADFICLKAKIIIEIDGGQHNQWSPADQERTFWLEAQGFKVLRFWNNEVVKDLITVKEVIWNSLVDYPHPNPPPERGRGLMKSETKFLPPKRGKARMGVANQSGMVLAIVLIFLLIISLLATSALSTSYLQIRMSNNLSDEVCLLEAAEAGLRLGEKKLVIGSYQLNFSEMTVQYSVEQLPDTTCVIDENKNLHIGNYFRITSQAGWKNQTTVTLQSIYVNSTEGFCESQHPVQAGRQSWRQLDFNKDYR